MNLKSKATVFYAYCALFLCEQCSSSIIGNRELRIESDHATAFFSGQWKTNEGSGICFPNPCKNDGICRKHGSSYQCLCPNGYTGAKCDKELLDACRPNPCLNGGLCHKKKDGNSTLQCYCPSGFTGLKCERAIDICHPNPCFNEGVCSKRGDADYACFCPPGFSGLKCEKGDDYRCDFEHSFCGLFANEPENKMNWTWTEARKTRQPNSDHTYNTSAGHFAYLDLWPSYPMSSSKLAGPWLYSDHCVKFWYHFSLVPKEIIQYRQWGLFGVITKFFPSGHEQTKKTFQVESGGWKFYNFTQALPGEHQAFKIFFNAARYQIRDPGHVAVDDVEFVRGDCSSSHASDVCSPNPCYNGGICEKKDGFNHVCYCPDGYTGPNCDLESDPCRSYPCYYGSTCMKIDGINFRCECPSNATGTKCERVVGGICTSNPCENGGTCHELQDGIRCDCPQWYTGETCTEDWWCAEGPGKKLCPVGACAFDHENNVGYCKWQKTGLEESNSIEQ